MIAPLNNDSNKIVFASPQFVNHEKFSKSRSLKQNVKGIFAFKDDDKESKETHVIFGNEDAKDHKKYEIVNDIK